MVNQRAIATALGLSTATISRALRNRGSHDAHTRALVLEEAAKLGYQLPKRAEQGLEGPSRLPAIGVVLAAPHPRSGDLPAVAMRLLHGISNAAREGKMMLHVEYLEKKGVGPENGLLDSPALRTGNLAGLIHIGDIPSAALRDLMKRFPGVRIALRDPGVAMDGIGQDDLAAVGDLVAHLRALGHEHIGFLGDGSSRSFIHARAAAFLQVMLQQGEDLAATALVNVATSLDESACAAEILAHIARGTTAWICIHDHRGYQLIHLLQQHGMRVPLDIAVCGFDALPVPNRMPALSTIDWPFELMGREAVKRLQRRIENVEEPVCQITFTGRLLVRDTSGTAAGRHGPAQENPESEIP